MRRAFEELGALYVIFWSRDGERYRVAADYEVPSMRLALGLGLGSGLG